MNMEKIYSTAKICSYHNETQCDLSLNPGKVPVGYLSYDLIGCFESVSTLLLRFDRYHEK